MIKLITLASGSSGNCYLLIHNEETLVIEQGIPFIEVKRELDYKINGIVGGICSHIHQDHFKHTYEYEQSGIPIFKPFDTDKRKVIFSSFTIQAFEVVHDVPCFGFYIKVGGQKILFVTDTEYVGFNFKKLEVNHIICECNYQAEYVGDDEAKTNRVYQTHMELKTCESFIEANKTPALKTVILCHLSKVGANPEEMINEVKQMVDSSVDVYIAKSGLEVDLEREF